MQRVQRVPNQRRTAPAVQNLPTTLASSSSDSGSSSDGDGDVAATHLTRLRLKVRGNNTAQPADRQTRLLTAYLCPTARRNALRSPCSSLPAAAAAMSQGRRPLGPSAQSRRRLLLRLLQRLSPPTSCPPARTALPAGRPRGSCRRAGAAAEAAASAPEAPGTPTSRPAGRRAPAAPAALAAPHPAAAATPAASAPRLASRAPPARCWRQGAGTCSTQCGASQLWRSTPAATRLAVRTRMQLPAWHLAPPATAAAAPAGRGPLRRRARPAPACSRRLSGCAAPAMQQRRS